MRFGKQRPWAVCRWVWFTLLIILAPHATLAQSSDASSPAGRWYVITSGQRLTFRFEQQGGGYLGARLDDQGNAVEQFDNVSWNAATRTLEFRRAAGGAWLWYRGKIVEGILTARFSSSTTSAAKPGDWLAYRWRLTGWNHEYLTPGLAPLVFDLQIAQTGARARLRIDRSMTAPSGFEGRWKFYAVHESCNEKLEEEFAIERWNGSALRFINRGQVYDAVVNGRTITGTLTQTGAPVYQWRGTRAEVLSYGFTPRTVDERERWQQRVRTTLHHLIMAGNPQPLTRQVREVRGPLPPLLGVPTPKRDDNPQANPQNYTLTELAFDYTLPNPNGGLPLERQAHGYLAKPTGGARGGGRRGHKYPLVVVLNGHTGSAYQVFDPASPLFWYGDGYARQGYMVLAVDLSHRPLHDRIMFGATRTEVLGYRTGYEQGDDPAHGNGVRPSIKPLLPPVAQDAHLYTDWEENGERVWDVLRALDYALARSDVDASRVVVTGLSMGGELASYVAALDPRVTVCVTAGYSPDLSVLKYNGSHGCWLWHYADIREYIDSAELFALIAPRPLIIETGREDTIYACSGYFFAGDKQIARRVRAAYGSEAHRFVHYLHNDAHYYRAGDYSNAQAETWVRTPARIGTLSAGDQTWQMDGTTYSPQPWTVFRYLGAWLGFRYLP
jgi:dienelactone hydrolase